jgi:hypothetical protein
MTDTYSKRRGGYLAVGAATIMMVLASAAPVSAAALNQQWIVQPSPLAGAAPDSILFANGSTLDAGLENVQVNSTYTGADVERFSLAPGVTLADVDNELTLATSGNPALAAPAMNWFDTNTTFHSGGSVMEHIRFQAIDNGGNYFAAQITPGRVAATAKPYTVRGTTTATLPATTQTVTMQPNDTLSVSTSGTIPKLHRTTLRVKNASSELHFDRFMPVSSTTTVAQAAAWCANPAGPSPITGNPPLGVGTMSGGVAVNVDLSTTPVGRYIMIDGLPDRVTGVSHLATMCKLVDLVN